MGISRYFYKGEIFLFGVALGFLLCLALGAGPYSARATRASFERLPVSPNSRSDRLFMSPARQKYDI